MRRSIFLIMLMAATTMLHAQSNITGDDFRHLMNEGRRLHADGDYSAALNILNKIDTRALPSAEQQEIEFLRASATFGTNHLEGRALLHQYLADYPETSRRDIVAALIAESYYYSHSFELANKWFKEADFNRLDVYSRERAELYYALTLQECGEEQLACNLLTSLTLTGKRRAEDAQFHLAAMQYHAGELQQAYDGLKKVEMSDKYYLEVPYYIAGVYVKQGKYGQAQQVAEAFIADHSKKPQGVAMNQMLGAALFGQEQYADAIAPLETYISGTATDKQQRIAIYQLALSYYETGQAEKAKPLLEQCSNGNDAVAQNSLLHLGMIAVGENNMTAARMAFEQAANMDCDNALREEALYNYALCLHQTRYSPFAESVKVFERFLNEYPQSKHSDQVNKYLVEVYMNTRNYDVALESIEKIAAPSPMIYEAKQKVLYRLGVQEYINGNMDKAIEYFNRSIALSQYNKGTYSEALYWRGEALYNKGDYAAAAKSYKSVISLGDANSNKAIYGLAYTYFQSGDMNSAEAEFLRFIKQAGSNEAELRSDAYNRIADCYFYKRNYGKADEYYRKAGETHSGNADYALYRSAITQGLKKDYRGKVTTLNNLVSNYPSSSHAQQAYYEMARAYIELEENAKAIEAFEQITARYPNSDLARRAAVEKAMLYNNDGNHSKAIEAYKSIITQYPGSAEAQVAAQDLKNIYVETGDIEEYTRFAANTKGIKAVESSEADTLTFIAAEKIYGRGDIAEAKEKFNSYINKFPNGAFATDSHYYLGVINYNLGNKNEALAHLEQVIALPDNKYSEEAMAYGSEIYLANGEWSKAKELYQRIIEKSSDEERRTACRFNLMQCTHNLGDHAATIAVANEALKSSLNPERKRAALYYRAKALLATNDGKAAEKDLAELAKDTRTTEGAEAKYLLAQLMFDQERSSECEKEIMEYIDESTPHAYWLARSFVLLADLYASQGRNAEAKQYLVSLQSNYSADDDIKTLIEERLNNLSTENQ
ncbi:MAG: tetratricopeptide repeat protein [Bacteroidaceae bacterium]|nr:tetratricopeptide repeat protein [Bacteroidaceae bacterium]